MINITLHILFFQCEIKTVSNPTAGIANSGVIMPIGAIFSMDDRTPEIRTMNAILLYYLMNLTDLDID